MRPLVVQKPRYRKNANSEAVGRAGWPSPRCQRCPSKDIMLRSVADSNCYVWCSTSYNHTADDNAGVVPEPLQLTNVERARPGTSGPFSQGQPSMIGGLATHIELHLVRERSEPLRPACRTQGSGQFSAGRPTTTLDGEPVGGLPVGRTRCSGRRAAPGSPADCCAQNVLVIYRASAGA